MSKKISSVFAVLLCICLLFTGCDSLTGAFSSGDEEIKYSVSNGEAAVIEVPNKSTVTVIEIPDEYEGVPVTEIADFSAFNLEYVTEIKIGKNVKEIGTWSMTNNQHLKGFTVDEENPYFCSVDGVIYTKDMKTLVYCPPTLEGEYEILEGVEVIRSKAFYKCSKLGSVILPQTVTIIEEKAFFRCEAMESVALAASLKEIGKDAFSYCYGLTEIDIPESIKGIGDYAFYNCTNLLKVNVAASESDLELGEKWYPTNNGLSINELVINWK